LLLIRCPWCGERAETEFTYGGDATLTRPAADASDQEWTNYVYVRDNPRGPHREYWHHRHGCRQWLRVERDTLSHAIALVTPAAESSECP
jgi:methylglutamate dehydrogenase subunit B